MARTQTLVQLTDELVALLDQRAVASGRSRSALVREALAHYLASDRDAEVSRQIVEGYRRIPQGGDDLEGWAQAGGSELLEEEAW